MSVSLTVLYHQPADKAAFDKHYDEVHAPLASTMPDLQSYTVVRPGPGADGAAPEYHLIATLVWPSPAAMQAAMGSPEGKAGNADLANFAQAGTTILVGGVEQVV
ncbi:EthD family reductase [Pseudonocardia ailaonensis]|uniref:EthD family reductase n=1 Tax=Pseudonocardia ailaonensis TaxID=367279 RepID=A0ABN2NBI7_9PSEU